MAVEQKNPASIVHVDRPEVAETFVDSVRSLVWDGQTARIELCVPRYPEADGAAQRHTAVRLVATVPVLSDLFNRLQQTMPVLEKAGLVAKAPPPGAKAPAPDA